jgi:hypothetical protein
MSQTRCGRGSFFSDWATGFETCGSEILEGSLPSGADPPSLLAAGDGYVGICSVERSVSFAAATATAFGAVGAFSGRYGSGNEQDGPRVEFNTDTVDSKEKKSAAITSVIRRVARVATCMVRALELSLHSQ